MQGMAGQVWEELGLQMLETNDWLSGEYREGELASNLCKSTGVRSQQQLPRGRQLLRSPTL